MEKTDRFSRAIGRSVLVFFTCSVMVGAALGQTTNQGPDKKAKLQGFEVATIKPHPAGDHVISMGGPSYRYEAKNVTAKILIEQAFGVPADQVSGGPPWIETQHFDVSAKMPDAQWEEIKGLDYSHRNQAVDLMLQSLLKDRFGLIISHQPKELSIYALMQTKGGAKLHISGTPAAPQTPETDNRPFSMAMDQKDIPVTAFTDFLSSYFRRTVLDRTGLTGKYDIKLEVGVPTEDPPEDVNSLLFRALEDQLGLKIETRKEVVDTIVIEHLEEPSAN